MSANNSVTVVGNLTRDPELKFTNSGSAVVRFSLAVNHRWYNNQSQEFDEKANFFDVVAWGKLAENVAESLAKGDRVIAMGRMDWQSWENDNGDKRTKVEIVADAVGPDLLWATAEPTKNERSEGGSSRGGSRSGGKGRSSSRSRGRADEHEYTDDEEPF